MDKKTFRVLTDGGIIDMETGKHTRKGETMELTSEAVEHYRKVNIELEEVKKTSEENKPLKVGTKQ